MRRHHEALKCGKRRKAKLTRPEAQSAAVPFPAALRARFPRAPLEDALLTLQRPL